jgi:hypothetical protein
MMKAIKLRLIHWDSSIAQERAAELIRAGFQVEADLLKDPADIKELKVNPPDVFLIDLSRQPSHGLEIALYIRLSKPTRNIPIVFIGGEPEKVEKVRSKLPDAVYTVWDSAPEAIRQALDNPPLNPAVPNSVLDGYSDAPLVKKLGIKQGMTVSVLGLPGGFLPKIGALPDGVSIVEGIGEKANLILWFARSEEELSRKIPEIASATPRGGVWIIWPKKTGSLKSDLTQVVVRKFGLASGLVDYKVCSVDETWSGLLFAKRKTKSSKKTK